MSTLEELLQMSSTRHQHLCPRQVLGVRMGMYAAEVLELGLPQQDKRLFTFLETDGCLLDGVSAATGCWVGRRTMCIMDFGKMAATFVDTRTDRAVRIAPHPEVRQTVRRYATRAEDQWHAYVEAYQVMPVEELLVVQPVHLIVSMQAFISREGAKTRCNQCGEEIFNEREMYFEDQILCCSCAGQAYYDALVISNLSREILASISEG